MTLTATLAEMFRISLIIGKTHPFRIWSSVSISAIALAEDTSISSEIVFAPLKTAPNPSPGKMYKLFPWFARITRPETPLFASSNGDPLEKIALPSVAFAVSSEVHSAFDVGLESGNIIGLSFCSPICRKTSSVNNPFTVDAPNKAVHFDFVTTSNKEAPSGNSFVAFLAFANGSTAASLGNSNSRSFVISPLLSMIKKLSYASSSLKPPLFMTALCNMDTMPMPAEPAPHMTNF
mmetsp:Transcript_8043/g.23702  ORF Transcript_8043/g.23702 Transcript_8043/m.23702 type:complete len:235 (-) Transcript_8043:1250-1954(-)